MPNSVENVLSKPIAWKNWHHDATVRQLLRSMQANILKGHGREHTRNIFLSFAGAKTDALKAVVRRIGREMPSALDQLEAAEHFKATGQSGGPVICFFLRPGGYLALGASAMQPTDTAFIAGMQVRGPGGAVSPPINDPALLDWQKEFRTSIDAMLLIGGDSEAEAKHVATSWITRLKAAGATVLIDQPGTAIKRKVSGQFEGVEHFGYVDGRSQPLILGEDVEREPRAHWDPAFSPSQFLVKDPGDDRPTSFGSFFVFRKLEQDVKSFKAREKQLAAALGLTGPFEERAGALMVGRFEDGSPVVLDPLPTDMPPLNDFNYRSDEQGSRCPFVAHIRKTNPRGESPFHIAKNFGVGTTVHDERGHIMVRRGITYGKRTYDETTNDFTDQPSKDVGLLFMAYMSSIENQFEFTQATWANNANFVTTGVGVDPVIGQGPAAAISITDGWSGAHTDFDFGRFVTLKGGEYFFAPSRDFLKGV
ncbi:MAG TPA: Dyp-type peroxidase [Rhizobium sp.]